MTRRRTSLPVRSLQALGTVGALVILGLALTGLGEIALRAVGVQ